MLENAIYLLNFFKLRLEYYYQIIMYATAILKMSITGMDGHAHARSMVNVL